MLRRRLANVDKLSMSQYFVRHVADDDLKSSARPRATSIVLSWGLCGIGQVWHAYYADNSLEEIQQILYRDSNVLHF